MRRPRLPRRGSISSLYRLVRDLIFFVLAAGGCAGAWFALYHLAPTLIVGTQPGLQTLYQVIAAAMVAVVVLLLGSLFLISQQLAATLGQRSVKAVLLRGRIRFIFTTALLLSIMAIVLAGQVPSTATPKAPSKMTLAGAGMLAIVSSAFILVSTIVLAGLSTQATSRKEFMKWFVDDARRTWGGPAKHHTSITRQALTMAIRQQDGRSMVRTLEAMSGLVTELVKQHERRRDGRGRKAKPGEDPWAELSWGLLHAGEHAVRQGALWRDLDRILRAFMETIDCLRSAAMPAEAAVLVDGLAQLAAAGQQLDKSNAARDGWLPRCASELATLEAKNERDEMWRTVSTRALLGWACATVAVDGAEWRDSALYDAGHARLGSDPPFGDARALLPDFVKTKDPFTETDRWSIGEPERTAFLANVDALLRRARSSLVLRSSQSDGG